VQGIGWAMGTLAIAFALKRRSPAFRFLPLFVAFSASLISYATEMRPYASLFYSGAICLLIIWDRGLKGKAAHFGAWMAILFGHIYGICFLLFSLLATGKSLRSRLRSEWPKLLTGFFIVGFTLAQPKLNFTSQLPGEYPSFFSLIRQIIGSVSNPHKAGYIFAPLALFGFVRVAQKLRGFAVQVTILLFLTIIGPIVAILIGKYFFVPRQIVAGSVPFLALASIGLYTIGYEKKWLPQKLCWLIAIVISSVPWTLTTLLHVPPFPNQPFHKFRQIAHEAIQKNWKTIIVLDDCNSNVMRDYLSREMGSVPVSSELFNEGSERFKRECWATKVCIYFLGHFNSCSLDAESFDPTGSFAMLLKKTNADLIVHPFERDPAIPYHRNPPQLRRDW